MGPLREIIKSPQELWRVIKFGVVGTSGVFVNMGLFALCNEVLFGGLPDQSRLLLAGVVAVALSILTNFLLNDAWTWRDRRRSGLRPFVGRMAKYYVVAGAAGLVQLAVLALLGQWVGINDYVANLAGILAGTLINFFVNHLWTFKARDEGLSARAHRGDGHAPEEKPQEGLDPTQVHP